MPLGAQVYLAVSPVDAARAGMAEYRGAQEHMPLPAEFKGEAFNDPIIKKAYLNYCRRAVDFFKPNFMTIGIETNEVYHNNPAQWPAYVELHRVVYRELKKDHPRLSLFASFTVHSMLDPSWKDREQMLAAFQALMDANDVVAISLYPLLKNLSGKVDEAFGWLTRNFDQFQKPYAVAETGESAESLTFAFGEHTVNLTGSPELQASYYEKLLSLAQAKKLKFVIAFLYKDYDALWEKIKATSPAWFMVWRDCGLVDEKGNKRPAYNIWRKYFEMPVE